MISYSSSDVILQTEKTEEIKKDETRRKALFIRGCVRVYLSLSLWRRTYRDDEKKKVTRGLKIEICVCDASLFPPFFVFLNFFYTTAGGSYSKKSLIVTTPHHYYHHHCHDEDDDDDD